MAWNNLGHTVSVLADAGMCRIIFYVMALEDVENAALRYRRAVLDEQRGQISVAECSRLGRELDAALSLVIRARERYYAEVK